jgi:hypothetical protein
VVVVVVVFVVAAAAAVAAAGREYQGKFKMNIYSVTQILFAREYKIRCTIQCFYCRTVYVKLSRATLSQAYLAR